jgi:methylmalonyl-CoA/ethylmalonyl-CoA epimerase
MKQGWTLHHLGYVVRDVDAALDYYEGLGLGPRGEIRDVQTPAGARLRIGMIQAGNVELELFQPVSGESTQGKFLITHGEGIQHLGYVVKDIEQETEALEADGVKLTMRGNPPIGKIAFFDTGDIGGVMLELVELTKPAT